MSIRIGVDAMGAENGVEAVIDAVKEVSKLHSDIEFVVFLNRDEVDSILGKNNPFNIIVSEDDIAMDVKSPLKACFGQKTSSMRLGLNALASEEIDAFITNGNTGALVAGAMHSKILGPLVKSVRPALMATIPQEDGSETLMLDVGAIDIESVDINMHNLIMSIEYLKQVKNKAKIDIGFLTIGTEPGKGPKIDNETISKIEEHFSIKEGEDNPYISLKRIEPNNLLSSGCDIMLSSGVRGNTILKTAEGVAKKFKKEIKGIVKLGMFISALTLKKRLGKYSGDSGAICLGVNGVVIKSHGGADKKGIIGAINQAIEYAKQQEEHDILGATKEALQDYKTSLSDNSQES